MERKRLEASFEIVARRFSGCRPQCGIILGSGWGEILPEFSIKRSLPYCKLPAMGLTTVAGHRGVLHWAERAGVETLIFQGRRHWYEGVGWEPVALPIFILKKLGAGLVVLTNSAGGIHRSLKRGAFMLISDHINAMGVNPLQGRHDAFWGKRFIDQTRLYDQRLRSALVRRARKCKIALAEGVYLAVSGPVYETPAEIRAYRALGADAVGMSTVPEAILAGAVGLRVLGLSLISNRAAGLGAEKLDHDDVRQAGRDSALRMRSLVRALWSELVGQGAR